MNMKFEIDGRQYEDYQLSNQQIVGLIESNRINEEERNFLMKKVLGRFKHECCPKEGEGRDELFAERFSDYVNACPNNFKKAAKKMACQHRYLQQEMFKVCIEYFKELEEAYINERYDGRNEWAVRTAANALKMLRSANLII